MQQNLDETKSIKTEMTYTDEMENAESVVVVNDIKNEQTIMNHAGSGLKESLPIKTELKYEDMEETPIADFGQHESWDLFNVSKNFAKINYEIKSEEVDVTYPSVSFKKNVDVKSSSFPDAANVDVKIEPQKNLLSKGSRKQWQETEVNQLNTEASSFKSDVSRRGKDLLFSCFHCDYSTNIKRYLIKHMLVHDNRKKLFSCANCDYSTKYKHCLARHAIKVHSENYEKHSCGGCEKHFKNKQSLGNHIIKNHQNLIDLVSSKIHGCPTCSYKTTLKFQLRRHTLKVHSGNLALHSCRGCEKHFKHKTSLDDHILKNHQTFTDLVSNKVHSCPTCDYKTTRTGDLRRHRIKVHLENRETFSCRCCDKHFKHKASLDDHIIKNHQSLIDLVSSKINSCATCNFKTTRKYDLIRHMKKVHSGCYEKYLCRSCEKYFRNKSSLDDHIIKNHQMSMDFVNSKIHNCNECDYKTTNKSHLIKHTIKGHS